MIWLGLGIISAALLCWLIRELMPEKALIVDNTLLKKHKGDTQSLEISEINEIKYHYHAVVGFIAVWEFIDQHGTSLTIDGHAKGMTQVLLNLESILSGFSLEEFKRQFEAGDVEDTLDVWTRP